MDREQLLYDFSPFVDIGENSPKISEKDGKFAVNFTRNGRSIKLAIDSNSGAVKSTTGKGTARNFASVATLLASDLFANLRRWADAQRELLTQKINPAKMIPINAKIHAGDRIQSVSDVSSLLGSDGRPAGATEVLLIDGPAGIGKTYLISQLALERASVYKDTPSPLILHIKSRGRVLSNLEDLMAFSLQTIRSTVTYDQIPVLVRHGLIVAAIDGFDELGDPNGYDTAWAQLSDLIASVRGKGTLVLAGRDTFISRERLQKDVNSLRKDIDVVNSLTMQLPSPQQAMDWLGQYGWNDTHFQTPSVSVLLEDNSFALRPVFLNLISQIRPKELKDKDERFLTSYLLEGIVSRESQLFGDRVESVISPNQIAKFITNFMMETAREMADMQTEALDGAMLSWIAEAALGDGYPPDIISLIKNRSTVSALLKKDDRPDYRAFVHTQIQNYYLARVTIEAISNGDIPKFIRRNILGAEFLLTFVDVASEYASLTSSTFSDFIRRAQNLAQTYPYVDRGTRNIGALLFASLQNIRPSDGTYLAGFQVDDAVARGTSGLAQIDGVVINQLDCRQADLGLLEFKNSNIISLIADEASRFSSTIPIPKILIVEDGSQITDLNKITQWLDERGRSSGPTISPVVPEKVVAHHIYSLLGRACRMRQYWLRAGNNDVYAERILHDDDWELLSELLYKHGFLRIEMRDSSGNKSPFYHIKDSQRLLSERRSDNDVVNFFKDLAAAI